MGLRCIACKRGITRKTLKHVCVYTTPSLFYTIITFSCKPSTKGRTDSSLAMQLASYKICTFYFSNHPTGKPRCWNTSLSYGPCSFIMLYKKSFMHNACNVMFLYSSMGPLFIFKLSIIQSLATRI